MDCKKARYELAALLAIDPETLKVSAAAGGINVYAAGTFIQLVTPQQAGWPLADFLLATCPGAVA